MCTGGINEEFDTHSIEDSVHIERRVDDKGSVEDLVPQITSRIRLSRMPREGQKAIWRIGNVCVHVAGILTIGSLLIQLSQERLAVGRRVSR